MVGGEEQGESRGKAVGPGLSLMEDAPSAEMPVCGTSCTFSSELSVSLLLLTRGSEQPRLQMKRGRFKGKHMGSLCVAKADLIFETI